MFHILFDQKSVAKQSRAETENIFFVFCDKRSLKLARELNTSRFSSISCAIVSTQDMITRPVTILSCEASEEVNFWRITDKILTQIRLLVS